MRSVIDILFKIKPICILSAALALLICMPGIIDTVEGQQVSGENVLQWGELQEKIRTLNPIESGTFEERIIQKLIFGKHLFTHDPQITGQHSLIRSAGLYQFVTAYISTTAHSLQQMTLNSALTFFLNK